MAVRELIRLFWETLIQALLVGMVRMEQPVLVVRLEKTERLVKMGRTGRTAKMDRTDKPDRLDKLDKMVKPDRPVKTAKTGLLNKGVVCWGFIPGNMDKVVCHWIDVAKNTNEIWEMSSSLYYLNQWRC